MMLSAVLGSLAILLLGTAAAAPPPPRVGTNPLRARRAWERTHGLPAPNPDAGTDAGTGEGNPDGGDVVDGYEFWWIGANSPNISLPNTGVQAVMQEVDTLPPKGFGCFDCWTSETLDNGYWGQVGFAACNLAGSGSFVSTFYQVWDTGGSVEQELVDGRSIQSSPGIHTYAMSLQSGTTWAYSVDGTVFGAFDMGSARSSNPGAIATLCEEGDGVPEPFVPPAVSIPIAMSLLGDGGAWAGAPAAVVYNTADLSGANGNLQDASLLDDAIRIGGTIPLTAAGTKLWNGDTAGFAPDAGPAGASPLAPPLIRLTAPRPAAKLSGTVMLTGTVTPAAAGSALTGVTFYVEDEGGVVQQTAAQGPAYSAAWDTSGVPNGFYDVILQAVDAQDVQTYVEIGVTVDNRGATGTSSSGGTTSGGATSSSTGTGTGTTSGGSGTGSGASSTSSGTGTDSSTSTGTTGGSTTGEPRTSGTVELADRGTGCSTGAGGLELAVFFLWILAGVAAGHRWSPDSAIRAGMTSRARRVSFDTPALLGVKTEI